MKASELKKGAIASINNDIFVVKDIQVQSPSSRSGSTLYKVQYRNVVTKQKLEQSYKGDDAIETVEFQRRPVQLLFKEAESCTFMDLESYEQYAIDSENLELELPYLIDGIEGVFALISDEMLLGVELPASVELEIVECPPAMKGASASARTKPATLSTGLVVQVPEYIASGEKIKVNTTSGEFMSRA
ncbi:elongation factor P-like protein YeiP [Pseudomonadota bacterium]